MGDYLASRPWAGLRTLGGWCLGRWARAKCGGEKERLRLNLLSNGNAFLKGSQHKNGMLRAEPSEV